MTESYLSVSIPAELEQFRKILQTISEPEEDSVQITEFGVKFHKNQAGTIIETEYFNDSGELTKKVYYDGAAVTRIVHYRNGNLHVEELYNNGKIKQKNRYKCDGELYCSIYYEYNKKDFVSKILKYIQKNKYEVNYDYDDFNRVNGRHIEYNAKILNVQKFRYDILDRVVEYQDYNQKIQVNKININNKLIDYSITDKAGNDIKITNKFLGTEYLSTEISLNSHKTTLKNSYYIDNILLKKPCATEDDMDYAISGELKNIKIKPSTLCETRRTACNDITNTIIEKRMNCDKRPLPISVRKLQLIDL